MQEQGITWHKNATAVPAALEVQHSDGTSLNMYGFRQLEFLSTSALRSRMLEIQHAYSRAGKAIPLSPPTRAGDELIKWILICQAYFIEGEIREDTLRCFGAPPYMFRQSSQSPVRRTPSPPIKDPELDYEAEAMADWKVYGKPKDGTIYQDLERGIGCGRRHIPDISHHRNGVPHALNPDTTQTAHKRYIPVENHLETGFQPKPNSTRKSPRRVSKSEIDARRGEMSRDGDTQGSESTDHMWVKYGGEPLESGSPRVAKVGCEGKRHIQVRSNMVNCGISDDPARCNELVPGVGHGPRHVDQFFTTSSREVGHMGQYKSTWRRDPKTLCGTNMIV